MSIFSFKRIALTTTFACSTLLASLSVLAAAPLAKTSAPGYFRFMLGAYEITAINDGTVDLPVDKLLHHPEDKTHAALADSYLKAPLETSVNTYLINTGEKLILVDVGAGSLFGPTLGKFVSNLRASGYTPEQIDAIYITHLHSDHFGGLLSDNKRVFPNATVYADKNDTDHWMSKANLENAPEDSKVYYLNAVTTLVPYKDSKKLTAFNNQSKLTPGIKALSTYGHTPGHTVYEVESEGQKLWLIGDLIHVTSVQLDHPEITIAFDSDPKKAFEQRDKIFTQAAKEGVLIGGAHIQFPGLGHLRKEENAYDWIPINYTRLR